MRDDLKFEQIQQPWCSIERLSIPLTQQTVCRHSRQPAPNIPHMQTASLIHLESERKKVLWGPASANSKPLRVTVLLPLRWPPGNWVVWCPLKIWRTAHFFFFLQAAPHPLTLPFLCCSCIATEELLLLHSSSCVGGGNTMQEEARGSRLNPSQLQLWMGFHWQTLSKWHQWRDKGAPCFFISVP